MISVVIPLYNKEQSIARCLESVLSQTIREIEVIVIDDRSTDNSVKEASKVMDSRITILSPFTSNMGVSATRNYGINKSTFELIAFLDADDIWLPGYLSEVIMMSNHYPKAIAYATHISGALKEVNINTHDWVEGVFMDKERVIVSNFYKWMCYGYYPLSSSSICVKKCAVVSLGGFNESLSIGEDLDMWIRLYRLGPIVLSKKTLAHYSTDAPLRSVHRPDLADRQIDCISHFRDHIYAGETNSCSKRWIRKWLSLRFYRLIRDLLRQKRLQDALRVFICNVRVLESSQALKSLLYIGYSYFTCSFRAALGDAR